MGRTLSDQDWLSLSAIARYWSEETGRNAEEIERDLEAWFSDFVERERTPPPGPSGGGKDTTNLLMGLLGGQYLNRETLATYCEETARAMPRFWIADGGEAGQLASSPPTPPSPTLPSAELERRSPAEDAGEAPQIPEDAAAGAPEESQPEPDAPDLVLEHEAPEPAAEGPVTDESIATIAPAAPDRPAPDRPAPDWPDPNWPDPNWPDSASDPSGPTRLDVSPAAIAWPPPPPAPPRPASARRTIFLLAGGLALALASLAGGYALGQGGNSAPRSAPSATASPEAATALVATLREDLTGARQKIAILASALDRTEKEKAVLAAELHNRQRALDAAAARPDAGGTNSAVARATETDAKVAALTAELAAARAKIASLDQPAADREGVAVKRSLIEAATTASAQAMSFKAELEDARQRIGTLELEAQTAKAEANTLAAELTASRRQSETALQETGAGAKPTRQEMILAVEIAGTQAALAKRDLDNALERLTRSESEAEAAAAEAADRAGELTETRRLHAQATKDAEAAAAMARQELFLKAQSASSHAARLDQEADIAREQIVDLKAQARTARAEAAGLAEQIAEERKDHAAALERARIEVQAERQELLSAAKTAEAESAARKRELDAALERIAELEADPRPIAAAQQPAAQKPASAPVPTQDASAPQANGAAAPATGESQPSSTPPSGAPKPGQPLALLARQEEPTAVARDAPGQTGSDQAARTPLSPPDQGTQVATARANRIALSVDLDSLVTDPGRYDARQVRVTGSLLRLLEHYRLQSQSGLRTLVVDVAGIEPAQREDLQHAIAKAGLIGSVSARISGTVERLSANAYRLVADDLILLE